MGFQDHVETVSQGGVSRRDADPCNMGPDHFIRLTYRTHPNPDCICVSASNLHPEKAIRAFFYTLPEAGHDFMRGARPGATIRARLEPFETVMVHCGARRDNPRLFLYNAYFEDNR